MARTQLEGLVARLEALNPLNVLERGYAVAVRSDGKVMTSIDDVEVGEHMWVYLSDGHVESWVVNKEQR